MGCGASAKSSSCTVTGESLVTRVHVAPPCKDVLDVAELVDLCIHLAEAAGSIIRGVRARGGDVGVVDKGGQLDASGSYVPDVQTDADRAVDALVVGALRAAFPGLLVICEESAEGKNGPAGGEASAKATEPAGGEASANAREHCPQKIAACEAAWPSDLRAVGIERCAVFVDPLDGTSEFTRGNDECVTVLLGVALDGVPVAGVVHQPFAKQSDRSQPRSDGVGITVWGGPGAGVHGSCSVPGTTLPTPVLIGTNRTVRDDRIGVALQALAEDERLQAQCPAQLRVSATGWQLLGVLCGRQHALLLTRDGTKKWDICGPEALLRAAGGLVTDVAGRRYHFDGSADGLMNRCGILGACSCEMHASILSTVVNAIGPWPVGIVEDPSILP